MEIRDEQIKDTTVLCLSGRFDAYAASEVEKFFPTTASEQRRNVIVNLAQVNFVDSTGLATLIVGMKRCRQCNGTLVICDTQQPVRIIFELTRMDKVFSLCDTQEEALTIIEHSQAEEEV